MEEIVAAARNAPAGDELAQNWGCEDKLGERKAEFEDCGRRGMHQRRGTNGGKSGFWTVEEDFQVKWLVFDQWRMSVIG